MLRQTSARFALALGIVITAVPQIGHGEEPYYKFLSKLQETGHGEMAILYLQTIKDKADVPEDLKTAFDLEMARSLRFAAQETPNADLQQKYMLDAQQALDKFLKEHPDHDEAASAQVTSGDISLLRGQTLMKTALRKKAEKDTLMPEARKFLEEARPKYVKGAEMLKAVVDELAATAEGKGAKKKFKSARAAKVHAESVENWTNARFKIATVDYNIGLTYSDPKSPQRKAVLLKAAGGFDALFQENRSGRTGIFAHMWEGKVREEMEEIQTAMDIYDEVMSAQPDDKDAKQAQWFAMFNDVNRFRLMLLGRNKDYLKLIGDAETWLAQNSRVAKTSGYQGIALELAKAYLEVIKTATGPDAEKAKKRAKVLLDEVVKNKSDFQKDAILVKRQMQGADAEVLNTFDDAIAVADAAAKAASESTTHDDIKKNWTEAEKAYTKAVEFGGTVKDKNRVLMTRFALAQSQFMVGKGIEAYDNSMTLARENPQFNKAPAAAALGVNIALYLYGQTRDEAAMKRINDCTDFVLKTWPQHAEADDARIALGKLKLIQRDFKGAIEIFLGVNPASDRYPSALQFASQTHWALYQQGKMADPDGAKVQREKAVELAQKCLIAFEKIEAKGALAQSQKDAQLLMAEIKIEENQFEEAAKFLQPLFDEMKNQPLTGLDQYTRRLLVFSMKTFAALEKNNEAAEVGNLLVSAGEDSPIINSTAIEYVKIAKQEWIKETKRTADELAAAEQKGEEGVINNAKLAQKTVRDKYVSLLEQLTARKQYDLQGLLFLADICLDAGLTEKGRDQYQAIIDRAAGDPNFAKKSAAAVINARAKLIAVLRQEQKYDEALKQVEALLKDKPNALEPMFEKGNILQTLAEKDPKKYDKAAEYWATLRNKLQNPSQLKKPPEYYEVVYNLAFCLIAQKQAEKYTQANQLLSSSLAISPTLDSPERVTKFKELQKQIPASAKKTAAPDTTTKPKKK